MNQECRLNSTGVSNRWTGIWTGIWTGTVEWTMEWTMEFIAQPGSTVLYL